MDDVNMYLWLKKLGLSDKMAYKIGRRCADVVYFIRFRQSKAKAIKLAREKMLEKYGRTRHG